MRPIHRAFAALLLAAPLPVVAQGEPMTQSQTADLSFERVFASPDLNGVSPRGVKLSPDGRYLTLLRGRDNDKDRYDLWAYDRETSQWSMLVDSEKLGTGRELSEDEKMQRERQRIGNLSGIVTYEWTADGAALLVPLDGDLYLAGLDGSTRRLTDTEESELNPKLSPESGYVSFVRDRQVWIGKTGEDAKPITPREGDLIRWGEAEFVAQEEMGRLTGLWWSPDETRIAVQRTDESPVGVVTRAAIGATGTKVFDQRYPVAGSDNAIVELFVMDPNGLNRVKVDLTGNQDPTFYNAADPNNFYLARVDWSPNGELYVQRQNRAQDWMDVLKVDPKTGATEIAIQEEDAMTSKGGRGRYWINLSDNYRFLEDGSLLWWSERNGFGHLYFYPAEEKLQGYYQLTEGQWVVTKLVGVDEDAGRIFFTATSQGDVLEQHVYSIDYRGSDNGSGLVPKGLTQKGFTHTASMDLDGKTLLVSRSSPMQPPQSYLADQDGKRLAWIEENAVSSGHPYAPHLVSHIAPEFGTIEADDGTVLHWRMIKPAMEPGKRYPVLFSHYGGPHVQVVDRGWGGALEQAVVDKGYIWFEIDNRGTDNRGVAFEQPIYHAMGGVEVADQKVGAKYLKSLPFVDADKIALYGWSYGGYLTLKQLQADPGLYAAGIAGAPVTRWELYDTHYTERYMGDPRKVKAAYDTANAIDDAGKMIDPLLLIHGMADDNVVFENSSELIAKLQSENSRFEMMLYPGYTHRVGGEQVGPHLWNTIFDFLARNGVTPPE